MPGRWASFPTRRTGRKPPAHSSDVTLRKNTAAASAASFVRQPGVYAPRGGGLGSPQRASESGSGVEALDEVVVSA